MKNIWYHTIRIYVSLGLFFLHKKIKVSGVENIPKKGAVIFIGNHQNALIDALLIPTTNKRITHFLARASAFKNNIANYLLQTVNMIPVYRLRDGVNTMEKNYPVFEQCVELLHQGKALEIFAEGEHHLKRKILPFKKGFARIILSTLQKYPNTKITIIPVGLNYDSHLNYPSSASIIYGKPIYANPFFDLQNPDLKFAAISNEVSNSLKKLTLHIPNHLNYEETINKLEAIGADYLNPKEVNELIKKDLDKIKPKKPKRNNYWLKPFYFITRVNSFLPLLLWKYFQSKINDIIFTNTYRFALILTVFPLFYLIQTFIIYLLFDLNVAIIYLAVTILLGILYTKTAQVNLK